MRKLYIYLFIFFNSSLCLAQGWLDVNIIGGDSTDALMRMEGTPDGNLVLLK